MHCPFCARTNTKVVDTRDSGSDIRRRRECALCGMRFTTYERVQMKAVMVVKQDGRREEFSRDKLRASLMKACAKRPMPVGTIEKIIDDIEARLFQQGKAEFASRIIGELVMDRLSELDRVAYIRFASVYRDFSDIESFRSEIDALLQESDIAAAANTNQLPLLSDDEEATLSPKRRGRPRKSPPRTTE